MYIIEKLKKDILKALSLVNFFTILRHYKICFKKMDLDKEKIVYRIKNWKKLIFHKKIQGINDDK